MTSRHQPEANGASSFDAAIVGAGLAGTLAATALARAGCHVALLDLQAEPQPEFRAEQLVGSVVDRLAALGALAPMTAGHPLAPVTFDTRFGRVVSRTVVSQYGVPYQKMVSGARAALPSDLVRIVGRVTGFETGDTRQAVLLADGRRIDSRLLVLATGLSTVLPKRLGLTYRTIRRDHSVALGFDIAQEGGRDRPAPFVQHAHSVTEKLDYLAVFAMGDVLRGNLFSYQDASSPWIRAFCRDPDSMLAVSMPGLEKLLGPYGITGPIQTRSNDLRVVDMPVRDGVVVVGDAFQTPCPAAGTGIDRLISDVATLARHAPGWMASPGMGRAKIDGYYADPEKRAADAEALRIAEYRRAASTEQTLRWAFHRSQVRVRRRVRGAAGTVMAGLRSGRSQHGAAVLPT